MKLVSACLLGINCNYKGSSKPNAGLLEEFKKGGLFPVCPEVMGKLPTPRPASQMHGGSGLDVIEGRARVINAEGGDVTENFVDGANAALEIAKTTGAKEAVLKARSPSCGVGKVYDGFSGNLIEGDGVFAAVLKKNGISVTTEDDLKPALNAEEPRLQR